MSANFVEDLPSIGLASVYMNVLIQEAYDTDLAGFNNILTERIEFSEETAADSDITLFEKLMHYESGRVRQINII